MLDLETKYLYLLLNLLTISLPFIRSFDKRVKYYTKLKSLFLAFLFSSVLFIPWDVYFAKIGVWGFNPKYLLGIKAFHLPLEEWLFFVTIPYACLFIYEVVNYFYPKSWFDRVPTSSWAALGVAFLHFAFFNYDRTYSVVTFSISALFSFYIYLSKPNWIGKFIRAFLISLIGFFLVNGVLTGTGIEEEVVWYNPSEITGIRILTIPIEDFSYCYLLLGINITLFEFFKKRLK